jgi:glycosyltransferase involved in cell wall biosynthesis
MDSTLTKQEPTPSDAAGTKPLRILVINEFFYPENMGGSGSTTSDRVAGFIKRGGVDVTAITSIYAYRDPDVRYASNENWGEVKIHRVKSPNWGREKKLVKRFLGNLSFSLLVALKALRLPRPDVVMLTTAPTTGPVTGVILRALWRVPYVYLIYDLDPDRTVALGFKTNSSKGVVFLRGLQRKWLHKADRVIALGRCMRDHLIEQYDLDPSRIVVVESVVPDAMRPVSKDTEFRRSNSISGLVVLYSGNFGQYHDFDTLLNAAEKLQGARPDITFVMVGGGAKKEYVEQVVAQKKLANVRLFPFVPEEELADLMGSADVHIVTLDPRMEGLAVPGKFYTCLASGRPVIAIMSAGTEVAKVIDEADLGWQVEVGDAESLIEILNTVDPKELEAQGLRARDAYDRLYTGDRLSERLLEVLSNCAKSNR